MSILFKGNLKEGDYKLIKTTNGWVLDGEIAYVGVDRPQGKWEYHSNPALGINPEDAFCPYCEYRIDTTVVNIDNYNYCPNCGARMEGVDNE